MKKKLNKQDIETKIKDAVIQGADPYAWAFMQGWIDEENLKRFVYYYRRKKITKESIPSLAFIDICNKLNREGNAFGFLEHMGLLKK